jgi:hypothetical protein
MGLVAFDLIFSFFFHHTATTAIYTWYDTLSLHDALPISVCLCHPDGRSPGHKTLRLSVASIAKRCCARATGTHLEPAKEKGERENCNQTQKAAFISGSLWPRKFTVCYPLPMTLTLTHLTILGISSTSGHSPADSPNWS